MVRIVFLTWKTSGGMTCCVKESNEYTNRRRHRKRSWVERKGCDSTDMLETPRLPFSYRFFTDAIFRSAWLVANRRKWRWYEVIRPVGSLLSPDEENGLSDQGSRRTDARDSRGILLKIQKLLLAHACDPGTSVTLIQDGWRDFKPCGRSKSTMDTEPGWWNLFSNSSRISEGTSV